MKKCTARCRRRRIPWDEAETKCQETRKLQLWSSKAHLWSFHSPSDVTFMQNVFSKLVGERQIYIGLRNEVGSSSAHTKCTLCLWRNEIEDWKQTKVSSKNFPGYRLQKEMRCRYSVLMTSIFQAAHCQDKAEGKGLSLCNLSHKFVAHPNFPVCCDVVFISCTIVSLYSQPILAPCFWTTKGVLEYRETPTNCCIYFSEWNICLVWQNHLQLPHVE